MKDDIEEPVKKSWKVFAFLLLLLVVLIGIAVLLIIWYLDDSKNPEFKIDISRIIMSGVGLLLLIMILLISLVNFYKPHKKKTTRSTQGKGKAILKKKPALHKSATTSKKRVSKR